MSNLQYLLTFAVPIMVVVIIVIVIINEIINKNKGNGFGT